MNILLVAPASGDWRRIGRRKTYDGKTFRFAQLSLLTVAALSPKDAKIRIVDEQIEDIPEGSFDLVGVTAMTALAPRAYEICAHFRAKGVPVVMGGFHATLNTEEVLRHADVVVTGPAYGAWEKICEDVEQGKLERLYRGDPTRRAPVHLPRHLLARSKYMTVNATFATMGCTNNCRFCSINRFHCRTRYERAVEDVVEEVTTFSKGIFTFVDDNLTENRDYALKLFRALAPLRKRWVIQASIEIAEDFELLQAMQDGGCMGVFIGLETFSAEALAEQNKSFNLPTKYRKAIRTFHDHGIFVESGVIVGFDADGPEVFHDTLRMLEWVGIDAIQLAIMTPLPGTPLQEAMQGRITDRDWSHYDYRHAVFTPRRMSQAELQSGADWLIKNFYARWRIFRRMFRWIAMPGGWRRFIYPLGLNLAYLGRVKRFDIQGRDPAVERDGKQGSWNLGYLFGK